MTTNQILIGDVRQRLADLPDQSVDVVVTSPPYFRLRNYGKKEQIGLEDHIEGWATEMQRAFIQIARILKQTGSVWLNLGDSYSRDSRSGAPAKGLLLGPERLLLKLASDGWIVRNKVIWAKTNPMPNSVRDRLSCTHEYVYFLTRSKDYFFDLDAVRVPHRSKRSKSRSHSQMPQAWVGPLAGDNRGLQALKAGGLTGHPLGKNPGDVWQLATSNFRGAHFATFPESLVRTPLLAACPERVCASCGSPWTRERTKGLGALAVTDKLEQRCTCPSTSWKPGIVLDPFFGSGTVGVAAERLNRHWLGIELNPDFAALARERLDQARGQPNPSRRAA